ALHLTLDAAQPSQHFALRVRFDHGPPRLGHRRGPRPPLRTSPKTGCAGTAGARTRNTGRSAIGQERYARSLRQTPGYPTGVLYHGRRPRPSAGARAHSSGHSGGWLGADGTARRRGRTGSGLRDLAPGLAARAGLTHPFWRAIFSPCLISSISTRRGRG